MFEDKVDDKIAAALEGNCFQNLQEAIDKAFIVEEKKTKRELEPSFAFLQGIEPPNTLSSFEFTVNKAFKETDSLTTIQKAEGKRKLETRMEILEQTIKVSANAFAQRSKNFAENLALFSQI